MYLSLATSCYELLKSKVSHNQAAEKCLFWIAKTSIKPDLVN